MSDNAKIFSLAVKFLSRYKLAVIVMFFLSIFCSIDLSVRKYIMKEILDVTSHSTPEYILEEIKIPVFIYIALEVFITSLFRLYGYFVDIKMMPYLKQEIITEAFSSVLKQNHLFHQENFVGELTNKVMNLTDGLIELIKLSIDSFFRYFLSLFIAIYTLTLVNGIFAIATSIWVVIFTLVSCLYFKKLSYLSQDYSKSNNEVTANLADNFVNIRSVSLFSKIDEQVSKFLAIYSKKVCAEEKLQISYFWIWFIYGYSFVILQGVSLYLLIYGYKNGSIFAGDIVLVIGINLSIVDFLNRLTGELTKFTENYGKVKESLSLLKLENVERKNQKNFSVKDVAIIFDKVTFAYPNNDILFKNISVKINHGEKVALVGKSGSGKTTFINLILGLLEAKSGDINIGNQNIKNINLHFLRENISVVPQENILFHSTILENIIYGSPFADKKQIIESIKLAGLDEFIESLPQKYNTLVGDNGMKLSGGERQRVVIARAFLKKSPILIFDEITNHLDSLMRSRIQSSILKLIQGKTAIIISHNLSTLAHMDRILVFNQGKIVQDGKHEELIKTEGVYKDLWKLG